MSEDDEIRMTRIVKPWGVWHGRHLGSGAYAGLRLSADLLAVEVRDAIAPDYAVAKCELNLPKLRIDAWRWKQYVGLDDRIVIASDEPEPADREILFCGHVVDVDHTHQFRAESVMITAAATAFRLRRDAAVAGRYMLTAAGQVAHFSAPPCHFNAGGRPNRHAELQGDMAGYGAPDRGVAVFTYDADPDAVYWSPLDIYDYLLWSYNEQQTQTANATFAAGAYEAAEGSLRAEIAVEGQDLLTALAAVGEATGYDVIERFGVSDDGSPVSGLVIQAKDAGTLRTVKHQPITPAGQFPDMDPAQTDLFSASISESATSAVTRPIVVGGAELYEITVELQKAWDPAKIDLGENDAILSTAAGGKPDSAEKYCKQYIVGGADFAKYADVGRLWDANTDGRYSAAPYNLSVTDVAALAGQTAMSWPEMPHEPLPCLSRLAAAGFAAGAEAYLELSVDGGTSWYGLTGFRVLADRLGVWLTMPNLADVTIGGGDDLFTRIKDDAANVKLRMTCTIASPHRSAVQPAARATAGTHFEQVRFVDAGKVGVRKTRAASSRFAGLGAGGPAADETSDDYLADLEAIAAGVQDAAEDRLIEAELPREWPDPTIELGDRIERIEGIEYSLATNIGAALAYPRVVQRTFRLRPETYAMQLALDTYRKAGAI